MKWTSEAYGLFIDGEWTRPDEGDTFTVTCPANGERLCTCIEAGRDDVDDAVRAASAAAPAWRRTSPAERAALLWAIADRIEAEAERLAMVEVMDVGRPMPESRFMVASAADQFRYFSGVARTMEGDAVMLDEHTLCITLEEPLGVVAQIVPWNSPIMIAAWKLAPALAAGNTTVMKASAAAPLSVLELGALMGDVLPGGVANVLTGRGPTTGAYLLEHPDIAKISFTGSTEVGCSVADAAASKLIPATLELGGKSANIVFADCDRARAVQGTRLGILANAGQVCCAGSRVLVQHDIYDEFLADCVASFGAMRVGLPWEDGVEMGPLVDESQLQRALSYIDIGRAEGAVVACGGSRITEGELARGCFMQPTILSDVDNSMRVAQEEIFGPVAVFIPFRDEADAVRIANDSRYGLGGGVWTRDLDKALRVARAVETGTMWVNTFLESPAGSAFGGVKGSGYGRELHKSTLQYYSRKKVVYVRIGQE